MVDKFKIQQNIYIDKQSVMLSDISFTHNDENYLVQYMRNRVINNHQQSEEEGYSNYQQEEEGDNSYNHCENNDYMNDQQQRDENEEEEKQSHLHTSSGQDNNACNDSFLDLVDTHLQTLKQKVQNQTKQQSMIKQSLISNSQIISLSKHQLSYCLLQNQSTTDTVQLTNLLPVKSTAKIINSPFQFRLLNAKNKFLKRDQVEIILEPYQSVEIEFQIKKRQNQIGNIYETLRVDAFQMINSEGRSLAKQQSKFLKFEITFVKPKFEVSFIGRTFVKRVLQHKVAQLEIYPNQIGQYCINLVFSQDQFSTLNSSRLERIECQIETKGYVSIHPNYVILYQNQPLKISFRRLTQSSSKTSVILIKPINSSLTYVIGVKCMERVEKSTYQQTLNKISKLMI